MLQLNEDLLQPKRGVRLSVDIQSQIGLVSTCIHRSLNIRPELHTLPSNRARLCQRKLSLTRQITRLILTSRE
ncbi:hypothetical protein AcW2_006115 [Taiwanofungus camphoratus]|nr:hypothetical protein AcW2_006115 [Antrodia cinnamomea]